MLVKFAVKNKVRKRLDGKKHLLLCGQGLPQG